MQSLWLACVAAATLLGCRQGEGELVQPFELARTATARSPEIAATSTREREDVAARPVAHPGAQNRAHAPLPGASLAYEPATATAGPSERGGAAWGGFGGEGSVVVDGVPANAGERRFLSDGSPGAFEAYQLGPVPPTLAD